MLFVTESFGQNYPEEFDGSSDSISLVHWSSLAPLTNMVRYSQ
jgi:hypothetical protein